MSKEVEPKEVEPKEVEPKEVRLLESRDICRGVLTDGNNKYCLIGWLDLEFPLNYGLTPGLVRREASEQLRKAVLEADSKALSILEFNDDTRNSKKLLARVWNRAMYLLGYTEGNPESKPLKR